MSKYTTELRYICEEYSELNENTDGNSIDDIILKSIDKIFDNFEIFDEAYRKPLCLKILRHYYMREICAETVGLWKFWLNNKMNEIMPYYNLIYKSTLFEFNPLYDIDLERTHTLNKQHNTSGEQTYSATDIGSTEGTQEGKMSDVNEITKTSTDLYSDTPQGAVSLPELAEQGFLTNAREITDNAKGENEKEETINNNVTTNRETESENIYSKEIKSLDEYIERVKGKSGGKNYSEMIKDFRETFLNVDMLIIDELKPLFFQLW